MWPGLVLFLDGPMIPLANNGAERAAATASSILRSRAAWA